VSWLHIFLQPIPEDFANVFGASKIAGLLKVFIYKSPLIYPFIIYPTIPTQIISLISPKIETFDELKAYFSGN
jgi:hypothetical protein